MKLEVNYNQDSGKLGIFGQRIMKNHSWGYFLLVGVI